MAPFRSKTSKWDGKDENGRYENIDGFKFDIMTQSVVNVVEEMPKYFLAETPEEAIEIYNQYKDLLNGWAYSYSVSTRLNRSDLFGEALIGLARACRDWQQDRSNDFKAYASFKIRDALNEFVMDNAAAISVPAYIKKANVNLVGIKSICKHYNIDWRTLVISQKIPPEFNERDIEKCKKLIDNLINAAIRAKVEYEKFIYRVECVPQNIDYSDQRTLETDQRRQEQIEAALIVDKLKIYMDEDELAICNGIMEDKSYDQISSEMGKSKTWVSIKLSGLRDKIINNVGNTP